MDVVYVVDVGIIYGFRHLLRCLSAALYTASGRLLIYYYSLWCCWLGGMWSARRAVLYGMVRASDYKYLDRPEAK